MSTKTVAVVEGAVVARAADAGPTANAPAATATSNLRPLTDHDPFVTRHPEPRLEETTREPAGIAREIPGSPCSPTDARFIVRPTSGRRHVPSWAAVPFTKEGGSSACVDSPSLSP